MKFLLQTLKQSRVLYAAFVLSLVMLGIALLASVVDDRLLLGEPIWLKPIKFGVSIPVYCLSMAWLLSVYPYTEKKKRLLDQILGWTMIFELPLIMLQAFRGVRSHFNIASAFDAGVFSLMGIFIFINSLALFYLTGTAFFKKLHTEKPMQRAIQFGWLAMMLAIVAGQIMSASLAHSVGVPDGGPGLPLTHWSTSGGDWRVVHFFGMHGIQLFPLAVFYLQKNKWNPEKTERFIWGLGILYLAFLVFVFLKTRAGLPIFTV